jgi:hypothetical protein
LFLFFCAGDAKKERENSFLLLPKNGVERGKFDRRNYKKEKKK